MTIRTRRICPIYPKSGICVPVISKLFCQVWRGVVYMILWTYWKVSRWSVVKPRTHICGMDARTLHKLSSVWGWETSFLNLHEVTFWKTFIPEVWPIEKFSLWTFSWKFTRNINHINLRIIFPKIRSIELSKMFH